MAKNEEIKIYNCQNFGACTAADSNQDIKIPVIETIGGIPPCPHCHQQTLIEKPTGPTIPWKIIAGAVVGVAVIGGGIYALTSGSEKPTDPESPKPPVGVQVQDTIRKDSADASFNNTTEKQEEVKDNGTPTGPTQPEPPKPEPKPQNGYGTVNLGYGTYTGDLKNGKPHGHGTITYRSSHTITGSYQASAGDKYEGDFRDGRISGGLGYWTHDGNVTTINP